MLEIRREEFVRPWLEGVAVVANLVSDAVIPLRGVTHAAIESAVAVMVSHDLKVSHDLVARLRLVDADSFAISMPSEGADWVRGFEDALCFLAATIDIPRSATSPDSVAVFGVPVTRNEWDARADIDELTRMISDGTGLSVSCFWPAPCSTADLAAAGQSGVLLAMPYGRKAADIFAARTGARVVAVGLPLGFDGSVQFMHVVGRSVGRGPAAAEFIGREISRIVPRFEWVVPHSLLNRRIGLFGDVVFVDAMREFLGEVGCDVCLQVITGFGGHVSRLPAIADPDQSENVMLVVGNTDATMACLSDDTGFLEITFPAREAHMIYPKPYLGFNGSAAILQDMVNRMNIFEIMGSWKDTISHEEDRKRHKARGLSSQEPRPV